MVNLPPITATFEDIAEWERLKDELTRIKQQEIALRRKIFGAFFTVEEGTEYRPLGNGYRLKAIAKLDRNIDIAHFDTMRPQFKDAKINPDDLVKYKPELVLSEYRKLTKEQQHLVDLTLIIKPGAPTLEIVAPKEEK